MALTNEEKALALGEATRRLLGVPDYYVTLGMRCSGNRTRARATLLV
jgi:hypothetical protein